MPICSTKEACHNCGLMFLITKLGPWSRGFKTCPNCKNLYNRYMDSGPGKDNPAARAFMKKLVGPKRHTTFQAMATENERTKNKFKLDNMLISKNILPARETHQGLNGMNEH